MSRFWGRISMANAKVTISGLVLLGAVLAACNAGPLLKTGSLTAAPVAPPKATTSIDRALHIAATSARAQKCGFYFDPATLRTNFLAAETARGAAPDVIAKTSQSYDYTVKSVAIKISDSEAYCSSDRTASIKTALQGALTGNFEAPPPKAAEGSGGIADCLEGDSRAEKFNPDSIYDPLLNEPGKKKDE